MSIPVRAFLAFTLVLFFALPALARPPSNAELAQKLEAVREENGLVALDRKSVV